MKRSHIVVYGPNALVLARIFENCCLVAYPDVDGVWTIAWGHTKNVKEGDTCTQVQADQWLLEELNEAATKLCSPIGIPTALLPVITQNQFDALTDWVYNLGIEAFLKSTARKFLLQQKFTQVAQALLNWDEAGGRPLAGLLRRRLAEQALFNGDFRPDGSLKTEKSDFPGVIWPTA